MRVLLVEDHPLFRRGVVALLDGVPDVEVAGTAGSGEEAVGLAAELGPDLVLMDLQLPGMSGIEATRAIVSADPDVKVLVLSLFEDEDSVFLALRAGARGYVLKDADEEELIGAIRAVARGEAVFGEAVAGRVLAFFAAPRPAPKVFPSLTDREREILELIARASPTVDRADAVALAEDGGPLRVGDLRQAAGRRPRRGDDPCPRGRPRDLRPATGSPAAVEPDRPGLDPVDAQHAVAQPGVGGQPRGHLLGVRGLDGQQRPLAVADRAPEDDEALVEEPVHERAVLVPPRLLPARSAVVPRRAVLLGHQEDRHARTVGAGSDGPWPPGRLRPGAPSAAELRPPTRHGAGGCRPRA
jgi:DNA-binding NarL/FixJ family response regulator